MNKKRGLMSMIAAGAAIGAAGIVPGLAGLPRVRTSPPSEKPPEKRTNRDREAIRLAADRRQHKAVKRAENVRKAEEGKRK